MGRTTRLFSLRLVISIACVAATATTVVTATAAGARPLSLDQRSAMAVFRADRQALLRRQRLGRSATSRVINRYVAQVIGSCGGVLVSINSLPPSDAVNNAIGDVDTEIETDVELAALRPFGSAVMRPLIRQVGRLRWTTSAWMAVDRYLRSLRRVLALPQSHLCADLRAWVKNPKVDPLGTISWFERIDDATAGIDEIADRYERTVDRYLPRSAVIAERRISGAEAELGDREDQQVDGALPAFMKALGADWPAATSDASALSAGRGRSARFEG